MTPQDKLIEAVARAIDPEAWLVEPPDDFPGCAEQWRRRQAFEREDAKRKARRFIKRLNASGTHELREIEATTSCPRCAGEGLEPLGPHYAGPEIVDGCGECRACDGTGKVSAAHSPDIGGGEGDLVPLSDIPDRIKKQRGSIALRPTAAAIGISTTTLARIERCECPDIRTLQMICSWLKVSVVVSAAHSPDIGGE